ncbi:hypothetical protein GOP47_0004730 [Adiantum capillus-veneris]|uniref:Major facilitator superfamily (MFS) profile domain-containing protein n=1 Tax=Adiantum capillus-veneris TaxID=13818 RepID=A0A9D4V4J6_ADICA|nr:hypothetical protein GOP47_0004730 [Adiantum capillus-veneris]
MEWLSNDQEGTLSRSGGSDWDKKLLRTLFLVNLQASWRKLMKPCCQMVCFPLAAYFSVHHNRVNVIALGAMLWAIATFFVGVSSTFVEVAVSRALNGVGLAMVIPAIQSLVADVAHPEKRGLAFGWLHFTGNLGRVFGVVFAVLLAGCALGVLRFTFLQLQVYWLPFLVYRLAIDPRRPTGSIIL